MHQVPAMWAVSARHLGAQRPFKPHLYPLEVSEVSIAVCTSVGANDKSHAVALLGLM